VRVSEDYMNTNTNVVAAKCLALMVDDSARYSFYSRDFTIKLQFYLFSVKLVM